MSATVCRRGIALCCALALALVLAACGAAGSRAHPHPDSRTTPTGSQSTSASASPSVSPTAHRPLQNPDILVFSTHTLSDSVVSKVRRLGRVATTEQFAMAQFYYHENPVRYAAVDPSTFRWWTLGTAAESAEVWNRVAGGEIAIAPKLGRRIQDAHDYVHIGDSEHSARLHVGAYAQLFDPRFNDLGVDAVVDSSWTRRLGMVPENALLVTTGTAAPTKALVKRLRAIAGDTASVQVLGFQFDPQAVHTAILTGESVSSAVGTFNYTANANGTVNIEGPWVSANIRTVNVPILGRVTCNKVMLPQLIDALTEIQQRGLAKYINPAQYGGCFVPRFIAGTHQLSYHAFGLAIDLNVPENERGTRGHMNPQVVQVFSRWGFQWGGVWHYTDPMHFQLRRIVRSG
ncbi:M15 family metallopeptidase [Nocardioides terrisoli]|uniref:M15 family metallopeptidase n=1 Tax=Nocardioides terrisoli TaxID=3388267 RepID=UPI00287B67C4|nr:M15 family metallopeptidase [Nocardioides marmorisolisilvae]